MTCIESRPVPGKKWEYRFYVEFEGKSDQPGVVNALSGINAEALNMQILGNYQKYNFMTDENTLNFQRERKEYDTQKDQCKDRGASSNS